MKILFLFSILNVLIITSCGEDAAGIKYGTISGTVLNGKDSTLLTNNESYNDVSKNKLHGIHYNTNFEKENNNSFIRLL